MLFVAKLPYILVLHLFLWISPSELRGCLPGLSSQKYLRIKRQSVSQSVSSVTQSCPTLWDSMNRSTPGLPVHHHLPEFTQTHIHRVGDAMQPFHPLSSPFPPAPSPSQHQSLFQSTLCMRWLKYWSFSFSIIPSKNHPGLISFRIKHNTQLLGCAFFFFFSW